MFAGILIAAYSTNALAAGPILTITPSIITTTLRSDSETSIIYTVTNNAHFSISNLSVNPRYQTTGQPSGLALQNDECTGITLGANASCTFGLIISGANQPNSFAITPSVCGNGGQVCSTKTSAARLTANVDQITQPQYAYYEMFNESQQDVLIPVQTSSPYSAGTPVGPLHLLTGVSYINGITASLDGTRIYIAEQQGADVYPDIAVISGGPNGSLLKRIVLPNKLVGSYDRFALAVTPNDQTLYVTDLFGYVYAINLSTDVVTTVLSGEDYTGVTSVAISPDGTRAYLAFYDVGATYANTIGVINTANNQWVGDISLATGYADPFQVVVSPDGSTLYTLNDEPSNGSIESFQISNDNYTSKNTLAIFKPDSLAVSSDGNTLYVPHNYESGVTKPANPLAQVSTVSGLTISQEIDLGDHHGPASLAPDSTQLFQASGFNAQVVNGLPASGSTPTVTSLLSTFSSDDFISQMGDFVE